MARAPAIRDTTHEGMDTITLDSGVLTAAFAPGAGMVGCSLQHDGEELLGQRNGLAAYAETGSTFGIPLLAPWANRLDGRHYEAAGVAVDLDPDASPFKLDPGGLPIHGLLGTLKGWKVHKAQVAGDRITLRARLGSAKRDDLSAGFPFPFRLAVEVMLRDRTLTVSTSLKATGKRPVPVAFGYHPYLTLPGLGRADWEIALPVRRRVVLDARGIPTPDTERVTFPTAPMGRRTFDDLFDRLEPAPEFSLTGGGRRIGLRFEQGYDLAQVFAPPAEDFICFEPMTAPTNALVTGDRLAVVAPGKRYDARFSITVAGA